MGCFHGTCGITSLPIRHKDDVVMFILHVATGWSPGGSGYCNPYTLWSPMALPISGRYDDYGWIEDVDVDWNVDNLLDEMVAADFPIKNMDDLHNLIHHGGDKINLGYMMVHRWAYDAMLVADDDGKTIQQYKQDGRDYYTALCGHTYSEERLVDRGPKISHKSSFYKLTPDGFQFEGYGLPIRIKFMRSIITQATKEGCDFSTVEEFSDRLAEYFLFLENLHTIRKMFIPQAGGGSQTLGLELHEALCKKSLEYIAEVNAYFISQTTTVPKVD